MLGKSQKITSKLTICTAIFILPLGIMLFSILSVSLDSIRKDRRELKGIEVLRPAISLMQVLPRHIWLSIDRLTIDQATGSLENSRQEISALLDMLGESYEAHFGREANVVSTQALLENWRLMSRGGTQNNVLRAYAQFMAELCRIIAYVGDISGLVTDSDLEGAYLVAAAVRDLPQTQERMVLIGNLLLAFGSGEYTDQQIDELKRHLDLLVFSDIYRIQNSIVAAETLRMRDTGTSEELELHLRNCYNDIAYFAITVEHIINAHESERHSLPALNEVTERAKNTIFRLQLASLGQLEELIRSRIQNSQWRLMRSLVLAVAATIAAFAIIFVTISSIRRSTQAANGVFKVLEKNNLSVQVEVMSRDELGELMAALGGFLDKIRSSFALFLGNASKISTAVYDLSASAKEITTTANEQSASVAEIVSTMESSKNLSAQVAAKTTEVAELAAQTQKMSRRGAELHDANEGMMLNIRNQNAKIVEEIRNLNDVLSGIDESVQLIDTIADRTKLIAFNAALEASSSGEAGSRFAVVASEIRRFADNVVESVLEIKDRISELQSASEALIGEADTGSKAIDSGYKRMVEQKEVFENIVDVSQNVAVRSEQISNLSKQQELASAQIFTALKEISAGVRQFVSATASTSTTADNLNNMSIELKETLAQYQVTE